jgi:hypothetical protein
VYKEQMYFVLGALHPDTDNTRASIHNTLDTDNKQKPDFHEEVYGVTTPEQIQLCTLLVDKILAIAANIPTNAVDHVACTLNVEKPWKHASKSTAPLSMTQLSRPHLPN